MKYINILIFLFFYQSIFADGTIDSSKPKYFSTSQDIIDNCKIMSIKKNDNKEIGIDKIYTCVENFTDFNLYHENIEYLHNSLNQIINIYGEDSLEVKFLYLKLALAYMYVDKKNIASSLFEYVEQSKENTKYENNLLLIVKIFNTKAIYYSLTQEIDKSRNMYKKALYYQKKYKGKVSRNYVILLSLLALLESNNNNTKQAITYIDEIRDIFRKNTLNMENSARIEILMNMGRVYYGNKDFNKSKTIYFVALEVIKSKNIIHPIAIELLSELVSSLIRSNDERDYIASKMACEIALDIQKNIQYKDNLIIANIYLVEAQYDYISKDYKKSKEHFEKALLIIKKLKLDKKQKEDFIYTIEKSLKELEGNIRI